MVLAENTEFFDIGLLYFSDEGYLDPILARYRCHGK